MLVESTNPDVIIGTETWLSDDIKSTYFFNPALGFKVYRRDRPSDPHGGVLLAVKSDIEVLDIESHSTLELLSGTIRVGQKKMVLAAYYRPPDKVDPDYLQEVTQALTKLKQKFKTAIVIIAGDFNLPDIDWDRHTVTNNHYAHRVSETYLNIALDLGLEQVVNFPTRLQNTLDLIFMSHPNYKVRCKPLPPVGYKCDHDIVLLDTACRPHRARLPRRRLYMWKKADTQGIKKHLHLFSAAFTSSPDHDPSLDDQETNPIECMWSKFKAAVTSAVEKYVPTKMSSSRQTHPWVDTKLRRLMRQKQRAHWRAKKTGKSKHWRRYKDLQRKAQTTSRQSERTYLQKVVSEDLDKNPRRFWSYIKSRKQENEGVSSLIDKDGFLQSDSQKKSDILNNQFQSVYTREDTQNLPDKGPSLHPTMENIIVKTPGVIKLLKNLNPYKAAGPDTIPTFILKTAAEELAPALTKIFQHSLNSGTVPDDWRKANIVPIFKKGDKHQPGNYRPVSLTSVTCKILEHIVHSNIMGHFETNRILCDNQHGFRKRRSCETQLITTIHGIASKLRNGKIQVDVILLDFSKAFDKVPHLRLLHKLDYYGVRNNTLNWIKAFLSYRQQQVLLDGVTSSQAEVLSGVPQGTVLGPLLFLAFINDMPEVTTSETRLFADDGLLYREIKTEADSAELQKDLNSLEDWEQTWQMHFHPEKCQVIHMCTNKRFRKYPTYKLHGHTLEAVESAKYLGVTISEDLSWTPHVDNTASKALKTLGFLRRNMYHCTNRVRERTYNALVLPVISYAAAAWDPYLEKDIKCLDQVQRRGARYVGNNYWDKTPGCVSAMVRNLGWHSLQEKREDHRLTLMYKIQNNLVDVNHEHILKQGDSRTRGRSRLYQSAATSAVSSNSFYPRTTRQWNQLPVFVTDATSLEGFKAALANHRAAPSRRP